MSRFIIAGSATALLLTAGAACAQMPPPGAPHINARRHPNMAAAEKAMIRADHYIDASQAANHWDLQGHAARAKQLLEQAEQELKLSAETSNREHR